MSDEDESPYTEVRETLDSFRRIVGPRIARLYDAAPARPRRADIEDEDRPPRPVRAGVRRKASNEG